MTAPDIYPAFYRFAAVIGAVFGAYVGVAMIVATWITFAPKEEEDYEKGNIYGKAKSHS